MKIQAPNITFIIKHWFSNKFFIKDKGLGFTLVEVMIVVALIAALAVLAIPNIIRSRVIANESAARATLKTMAVALETHASDSGTGYTDDFLVLITGNTPYLNKDYIADSPINGYNFDCETLGATGYSCSATPQLCNQTGSLVYTVTTGAVFSEADCE